MFGLLRKLVEKRRVGFSMTVPASVRQEGGVFYAACDIFDVHSQGPDQQKALENLVEALQLFVETCYEQGTLEQVLKAQGFEPGAVEATELGEHSVEVPLGLIARHHAAAHAH